MNNSWLASNLKSTNSSAVDSIIFSINFSDKIESVQLLSDDTPLITL